MLELYRYTNDNDFVAKEFSTKFRNHIFEHIKSEKYLNFIVEQLNKFEDWFYECPGAVTHHHNFKHGLLRHTVEVIDYCLLACEHNPSIDKELVVTAAIIHDIGKCYNYYLDKNDVPFKDETIKGKVKHLDYMFYQCMYKGFTQLARVVGSHHGKTEWGAIEEPQSIEAHTLHQADMLSSRAGGIQKYKEHFND